MAIQYSWDPGRVRYRAVATVTATASRRAWRNAVEANVRLARSSLTSVRASVAAEGPASVAGTVLRSRAVTVLAVTRRWTERSCPWGRAPGHIVTRRHGLDRWNSRTTVLPCQLLERRRRLVDDLVGLGP